MSPKDEGTNTPQDSAKSTLQPTGAPSPNPALESDIARILEEVKLPERREVKTSGSLPRPPVFPAHDDVPRAAPASENPSRRTEQNVAPLHTLKDDLKSVVREQKISVIRAAALEEDKRARQPSELSKTDVHAAQKRRVVGSIAMIIGLLALGLIALGAILMIKNERSGSASSQFFNVDSLLFSEQTLPFPIHNRNASELKRLLADARVSANLTLGAITRIAPTTEDTNPETGTATERLATTAEFLDAIHAEAPEELVRALSSDFFFGFHTVDENAPILIIPVISYERAFAGMLMWEGTMNAELSPIFTAVTPLVNENGLLKKRQFKDLVMRNFDVRALTDDRGDVQLYYSFPTREMLVIAESSYSFTEILSRLRADRRL